MKYTKKISKVEFNNIKNYKEIEQMKSTNIKSSKIK